MEEKGESDSPTIFVIVKHPEKATGKNRFAIPYMYTLSLLLNTPDSPFTGIVLPDIATGQRRSKDTSNPILNNTHTIRPANQPHPCCCSDPMLTTIGGSAVGMGALLSHQPQQRLTYSDDDVCV